MASVTSSLTQQPSPSPSRCFRIPSVFEILKNQERIAEKSREYVSPAGYGDQREFPRNLCAPVTQTRVKKDDMGMEEGVPRWRFDGPKASKSLCYGFELLDIFFYLLLETETRKIEDYAFKLAKDIKSFLHNLTNRN